MTKEDDMLTCPRCGAEMAYVPLDTDEDQDWDYFSCPDCHFRVYAMSEDLTIDRYDSDPDTLWIAPEG